MKISSDSIQFGLLLISGIGLLGGFWGYCEGHFATKDMVTMEREERKELKAEVDAMYFHMIPRPEQLPLKHPGIAHE